MIVMYLLCIKGDTELNEYMDSLAREPERLTTPHNTDTGETILHLLAKVFFFLHLYPINPTSTYTFTSSCQK